MNLNEKLTAFVDGNFDVAAQFHRLQPVESTKDRLLSTNVVYSLTDYGGEDGESWAIYRFTDTATNEVLSVKFDGYHTEDSGYRFMECYFVEAREVVTISTTWVKV